MTKLSRENLMVADRARILFTDQLYLVEVAKNGNVAYLQSGDGIMTYPSAELARRAVRRIRPDLEPTTI
ncbi:MAG: hypothetical protein ACSLEX_04340 [Minisyncoccota bacterium]